MGFVRNLACVDIVVIASHYGDNLAASKAYFLGHMVQHGQNTVHAAQSKM